MTDLSGKPGNKEDKSPESGDSGGSRPDKMKSSVISTSSGSSSEKLANVTVLEMDKMNDNVSAMATAKQQSALNNNNNVPQQQSHSNQSSVHGSIASYNDGSQQSPCTSEKPTTYCEEGTPVCFSRVSSLSSLHSIDVSEQSTQQQTQQQQQPHPTQQQQQQQQQQQPRSALKNVSSIGNAVTQNYQRFMPQQQTPQPGGLSDSPHSQSTEGGSTGHHTKTVTFDQQSHVEETPLMFSRCSSLGSLSSFDAHSVHSSVVSEYSRRASEVVSPSDLPDSPSETMPSSPKASKSPSKFEPIQTPTQQKMPGQSDSACDTNSKTLVPHPITATSQALPVPLPDPALEFKDSPISYALEGSPENFSCATSLSALTIDDEPKVNLDSLLKNEESTEQLMERDKISTSTPQQKNLSANIQRKLEPAIPEEEPGNSSVSEGEEDMLLQCISSAMPSKSTRSKIKKSASDNSIKKKGETPVSSKTGSVDNSMPAASPMCVSRSLTTTTASVTGQNSVNPALSSHHRLPTFPPPSSHDYLNMQDTVVKYATEGTPLNFSTATSLSDLSCISPQQDEAGHQESQNTKAEERPRDMAKPVKLEGDISDSSSLCDETENLLSEAIQMAMPTKTPKTKKSRPASNKMDRTAEGCDSREKENSQTPAFMSSSSSGGAGKDTGFKKPTPVWKFQPERTSSQNSNAKISMSSDTMRTYETEGTPINFSTATSLSDLTIESLEDREQGVGRSAPTTAQDSPARSTTDANSNMATYSHSHDDSVFAQTQSYDSPHVFGIEGTPITFSRNDSLSSLSCDEDGDQDKDKTKSKPLPNTGLTPPSQKSFGSPRNRSMKSSGEGRSGIPSPRVKALAMSDKMNTFPSARGASKSAASNSNMLSRSLDDQPQMYAVEGTPMCFSRNSSLSSLNSDDHEGLANQGASADATLENTVLEENQASFKVEGTPVCFSRDSPLSALSVESLSSDYEPTPSEKAMLEECINMAMPKQRKTPKLTEKNSTRGLRFLRTSPNSEPDGAKNSPSSSPDDESRHRKSRLDPPDRGGGRSSGVEERRKHKSTNPKNVLSKAGDSSQPKTNVPLQSVQEDGEADLVLCDAEETSSQLLSYECTMTDSVDMQQSCCSETPVKIKQEKDQSNQVKSGITTYNAAEFSPTADSDMYEAMQCGLEPPDESQLSETNMSSSFHGNLPSDNRTDDNKLQDEVQTESSSYAVSLQQVAAQSLVTAEDLAVPQSVQDICSLELPEFDGSEKVDSTKSEKSELDTEIENEIDISIESGIERLDDSDEESDIGDITKETFPDMSYSLDTLSTPEDENLPDLKDSDIEIIDVLESVQEEDINGSPDSDEKDAFSTPEKVTETLGDCEISPEEERALEENANIILSELSFTRELSSCALDEEESLIENETISLVSNDYTSDTASEVSVSLSSSSKTLSEQTEVSSSTLSCTSSQATGGRPRIVKPLNRDAVKTQKEKEGPKPIRGGKKKSSIRSLSSLSSGRSVKSAESAVKPVKGGVSPRSVTPVKPAGQKTITPVKKTLLKSSPVTKVTGPKPASTSTSQKSPAQSPVSKVASQNGTQRSGSSSSPKGSPKPVRNTRIGASKANTSASPKSAGTGKSPAAGANRQPVSYTKTNASGSQKTSAGKSKLPTAGGSFIKTPAPTLHESEQVERPKPPIKQGTFTKDTPTATAPPVVQNEELNPDSDSLCDFIVNDKVYVNGGHVRLREKRKSGGSTPPQRQSGQENATPPQRTSGGTPPQRHSSGSDQGSTWTRALESFQFVVDRSAEAVSMQVEDAKKLKKRKNPPPPVPERRTSLIKTNNTTTGNADTTTKATTDSASKIQNSKTNSELPKPTAKTSPVSTGAGQSANTVRNTNIPKGTSSFKPNIGSTPSKTSSASALNKTPSSSSLAKSGNNSSSSLSKLANNSNTSLTKAGNTSNSSLVKTGSGSSIASVASKSGGSSSSLKTPSKISMKKSDSSASLKKATNRPTTPNGRPPTPSRKSSLTPPKPAASNSTTSPTRSDSSGSPPGSAGKKTTGSGKKPVVSKIASLWKKDDGAGSTPQTGGASSRSSSPSSASRNAGPEAKKTVGKSSGVPKSARKNSTGTPAKKAVDVGKKSAAGRESPPQNTSPSPKEGLSKSSTYDKIPTEPEASPAMPAGALDTQATPTAAVTSIENQTKTSTSVPQTSSSTAESKANSSGGKKSLLAKSNIWRRSPKSVSADKVVYSEGSNPSITSIESTASDDVLNSTSKIPSKSVITQKMSPKANAMKELTVDTSQEAVWVKRDGTTSPNTPPSLSPKASPILPPAALPSGSTTKSQIPAPTTGQHTTPDKKSQIPGAMNKKTSPAVKADKQRKLPTAQAKAKLSNGSPPQVLSDLSKPNGDTGKVNGSLPITNGQIPKSKTTSATTDICQNGATVTATVTNQRVDSSQTKTSTSPLSSPTKIPTPEIRLASPGTNAAIVAPFNYTPTPNSQKNNNTANSSQSSDVQLKNSVNQTSKSSIPSPTKPMTKTEMLIARRRQSYLNSLKAEDAESEDGKRPCLVTTV